MPSLLVPRGHLLKGWGVASLSSWLGLFQGPWDLQLKMMDLQKSVCFSPGERGGGGPWWWPVWTPVRTASLAVGLWLQACPWWVRVRDRSCWLLGSADPHSLLRPQPWRTVVCEG